MVSLERGSFLSRGFWRVYRKVFAWHLRLALGLNALCPACFAKITMSTHSRSGLTLLTCFHNEMQQLPGFFNNVLPQVDGIIGLDDASTDGSNKYFTAQPKMISLVHRSGYQPHVWNEPENKRVMIQEALIKVPNSWVLVLDADERLGRQFRQQVDVAIRLAECYGFSALSLRLGELWDGPNQFRVDGIWGHKRRVRLFKLKPDYQLDEGALHTSWHSSTLDAKKDIAPVSIYFYHLGMLTAAQRQHRREKYRGLDPDNRWQTRGYDYLTDTHGLRLKAIAQNQKPL